MVQAELVHVRGVQVVQVDTTLHRHTVHILALARRREFFATLPVGDNKVTGQEVEKTPYQHQRFAN